MPMRYLLEHTDIAITASVKPLVAGVIVHLLCNIQRFLRVLLAFPSPPAFALRLPNLNPEGFQCYLLAEIIKLGCHVDLR